MTQKSYLAPANRIELTGASQIIHTGACIFYGIAIMDEAAGNIKLQVYDGTNDSGVHLLQLNVSSNGNAFEWYGPNGIKCETGIYIKVYSGSPDGSVFLKA